MSRALVVGNGAAGTFSAWLLARRGWEVALVGRGTPSTAMSTGCLRAVPGPCMAHVSEFLSNAEMPWATGARHGLSRIGTPFECRMSPSHSTWEGGDAPRSIAVVGMDGHTSSPVRVASATLNRMGIRAEPLPLPGAAPSDAPLWSVLRTEEAWETLAERLKALSTEAVLMPATVPLREYHRLGSLERRCGRRVLEAISPAAAPGQRLADLMMSKAREAGVAVWDGRKVIRLGVQGDAVREVTVAGGSEVRTIAADAVVIASGGPLVDGLALPEREVRDPFGTFQVSRSGDALRGGYAVKDGRLVSNGGGRMSNVAGAGDCLASEVREHGSGLAAALEGAYIAVTSLEEA